MPWLVGILLACVTQPSPAPGCVKRLLPTFGGCFGKTAILDLSYQGPDCVQIEVNNCQGGELHLKNACAEPVTFEALTIPAGAVEILDIRPAEGGYVLIHRESLPTYVPEKELRLTFSGKAGEEPLSLSFTKTAPLCP